MEIPRPPRLPCPNIWGSRPLTTQDWHLHICSLSPYFFLSHSLSFSIFIFLSRSLSLSLSLCLSLSLSVSLWCLTIEYGSFLCLYDRSDSTQLLWISWCPGSNLMHFGVTDVAGQRSLMGFPVGYNWTWKCYVNVCWFLCVHVRLVDNYPNWLDLHC